MLHPSRLLLLALVWSTAAMTVVAGMPRMDCRCPDGQYKPFCLGPADRGSRSCCCKGGCCSADGAARSLDSAQQPVAARSCCSLHGRSQANKASGSRPDLQRSCCSNTLVQPQTRACSHFKTTVNRDSTCLPFLVPPADRPLTSLAPADNGDPWLMHLAGPPTNRVILLRHLVI